MFTNSDNFLRLIQFLTRGIDAVSTSFFVKITNNIHSTNELLTLQYFNPVLGLALLFVDFGNSVVGFTKSTDERESIYARRFLLSIVTTVILSLFFLGAMLHYLWYITFEIASLFLPIDIYSRKQLVSRFLISLLKLISYVGFISVGGSGSEFYWVVLFFSFLYFCLGFSKLVIKQLCQIKTSVKNLFQISDLSISVLVQQVMLITKMIVFVDGINRINSAEVGSVRVLQTIFGVISSFWMFYFSSYYNEIISSGKSESVKRANLINILIAVSVEIYRGFVFDAYSDFLDSKRLCYVAINYLYGLILIKYISTCAVSVRDKLASRLWAACNVVSIVIYWIVIRKFNFLKYSSEVFIVLFEILSLSVYKLIRVRMYVWNNIK